MLFISLHATLSADITAAVATRHEYSFQVGILCLLITFIGNGIHSSFAKLAGKDTPPVVYNLYLSIGSFLGCSAGIVAMGESFAMTWPGILGGILLCLSVTCYINAIFLVGIVWCDMLTASAATVTSFLWGKLYFQEPSTDAIGAAIGLVLLLLGILGISIILLRRLQSIEQTERIAKPDNLYLGCSLAVCAGTFAGTCFPVNKLQPPDQRGVAFAWAQATAMLCMQILFVLIASCRDVCINQVGKSKKDDDAPDTQETWVLGRLSPKNLMPLGCTQGFVVAAANLTTTVAALSRIGFGVAQPVREAGHSLAVLIGTVMFLEYGDLDAKFLTSLIVLTCVNVVGIVVLIVYGSAPH